MDPGLLAAIARFPDRGYAIEKLAGRDEEFRSLCKDLADAEAALGRWEHLPSDTREELRAEYRHLVRDLIVEIRMALDQRSPPCA